MMKRLPHSCCLFLLSLLLTGPGISFAADRSIQNFVSQREQWSKLLGVSQTLEGRVSTFNSLSLRFRNCPIPFYFAGKVPRLDASFKNVEVTGQLARENGRLLFKITSLKKLPTDLEQFVTDESKIDLGNPRDWYALADWGRNRAEFYSDKELAQKALNAYRRGIEAEYSKLTVKQPENLMKLADKAEEFKLDPRLAENFRHEALVLEWEQLKKQKAPDANPVRAQLLKLFPKYVTPLKADQPLERKRYLADQVAVFQKANAEQRQRMLRWFYSQIVLDQTLKGLAEGGSNGFKIASEIKRQLPERTDLVKKYQEMQLSFDFDRVAELPRQYVLDLAKEFQQRGDQEQAKQTLVNWVEARRKKLEPGDADGRVSVARDLIELTGNRRAAIKLLLEAWELNPKSTDTATMLGRLGYMLHEDKWLDPGEVKELRDDPIRKAIRNGTVVAGMNRDQVRKALGAPTQIGRSISGGAINELWIYGEAGNQSLIIQLSRSQRAEEFKVLRIKNAAAAVKTPAVE
ncbi:hypothetical protein Pan153_30130 [Gimesia panareensis]|uniref:Tetratricopeptide repeat protein n=1 Tax=Gimesia panareensis TaxID=2527978 RepID=A0A518FPT5_9PLAN|nr:hypothetical protein [Gimesia panareensis]QDV18356.1 hypothetical protein Pan153_30130 [Gimesia panareensis]